MNPVVFVGGAIGFIDVIRILYNTPHYVTVLLFELADVPQDLVLLGARCQPDVNMGGVVGAALVPQITKGSVFVEIVNRLVIGSDVT